MISHIGILGMKRLFIFIIALTALSGYALAHPPSGVVLSFDERSGDLSVAITHLVDDPATHYVNHVIVSQGNTVLIDQSYTSQPDKSTFTRSYNLPQLKGSSGEIKANAECSILGSRSGTLTLAATPAPGVPGSPPPAPTRASGCVLVVMVAVGLVALRITR